MTPRIYCGDCRVVLPTLPADSFDACLCDPPYGLEFMGKAWDHGVPSSETWAEVLRVLKPGAFLLAFGGTRTFHRLTCAIEDAGFEIRDCMMWLYGSGFPKSLDISKAIDKAAGAERTEVTGERHRNVKPFDDGNGWNQNSTTGDFVYTAPATEAAKTWNGYGTALKPAWEPIIVAMKPCDGTFAENALNHGVAGLNIDAGRIPSEPVRKNTAGGLGYQSSNAITHGTGTHMQDLGRWPANVILDEAAGAMLDEQSGERASGGSATDNGRSAGLYEDGLKRRLITPRTDSGGASRFFYCAKAGRSERGEGNTHPTVKPLKLIEYLARLILPPKRDDSRRLIVPFSGSGSEMLGAFRAGWDDIAGIEQDPHWCDVARNRLSNEAPILDLDETGPRRSDDWLRALGAQDAIKEEVLTHGSHTRL